MDEDTSALVGTLLVVVLIGIVITLLGARDMYEAWTELCLEGTGHQRCTQGQGQMMFGIGLAISIPAAIGLLVAVVRR